MAKLRRVVEALAQHAHERTDANATRHKDQVTLSIAPGYVVHHLSAAAHLDLAALLVMKKDKNQERDEEEIVLAEES